MYSRVERYKDFLLIVGNPNSSWQGFIAVSNEDKRVSGIFSQWCNGVLEENHWVSDNVAIITHKLLSLGIEANRWIKRNEINDWCNFNDPRWNCDLAIEYMKKVADGRGHSDRMMATRLSYS
jgi:hypothetical protein